MEEKTVKLCRCGCGVPVKIKRNGKLNDYILYHHLYHDNPAKKKSFKEYMRSDKNPSKTESFKESRIGDKNPAKRPEVRKKISDAGKGREYTDKTRKKIGDAHRGDKNFWYGKKGEEHPMFGVKHSEESRERMSKGRKGKRKGVPHSEEHKRKIGEGNKGKKRTKENRLNISKSKKRNRGNID